jgi:hypothetical protein
MQLPCGKLAPVAERRTLDPWKVIIVACRSAAKGRRFDKIAKLL